MTDFSGRNFGSWVKHVLEKIALTGKGLYLYCSAAFPGILLFIFEEPLPKPIIENIHSFAIGLTFTLYLNIMMLPFFSS